MATHTDWPRKRALKIRSRLLQDSLQPHTTHNYGNNKEKKKKEPRAKSKPKLTQMTKQWQVEKEILSYGSEKPAVIHSRMLQIVDEQSFNSRSSTEHSPDIFS